MLGFYRGTWLIRNRLSVDFTVGPCLGPYGSTRGGQFLKREVPLNRQIHVLGDDGRVIDQLGQFVGLDRARPTGVPRS